MDHVKLFKKHMAVLAQERKVTNFGRADDKLSRACSKLVKGRMALAESAHYDSMFDGGEFSGPANYKAEQRLFRSVAQEFGYDSVEAMANAVERVTSAKTAYDMFSGYNGMDHDPDCNTHTSIRSW